MRRIFITCDDCGLSEGINLAAAQLHQRGIATAASIMTNFPAAQHALLVFSRFPLLNVGVHLDLTEGYSLTKSGVSILTQSNGHFRSRPSLFARSLIPSDAFMGSAELELATQINVLVHAGVQPQHLTTHIHFHMFPALRSVVLGLARKYQVSWVRAHSPRAAVLPFNPLLRRRHSALPDPDSTHAIMIPNYVVVLKYWMGYNPEQLITKLKTLQGIFELVVHPCTERDQTFPHGVPYLPHERFKETHYLERFYELLQTSIPQDFVFIDPAQES
jgi:hypothetical protein